MTIVLDIIKFSQKLLHKKEVIKMSNPGTMARPAKKPENAPENCGLLDEFQNCRGCGIEINLVKPGHCHKIEGEKALNKLASIKKAAN